MLGGTKGVSWSLGGSEPRRGDCSSKKLYSFRGLLENTCIYLPPLEFHFR